MRTGSPTGTPAGSPVGGALFDKQPELEAAVAEHLEETALSFNGRITGWRKQGGAGRSEIQELLQ